VWRPSERVLMMRQPGENRSNSTNRSTTAEATRSTYTREGCIHLQLPVHKTHRPLRLGSPHPQLQKQPAQPSPPHGDPTNQFTPPSHDHDHDHGTPLRPSLYQLIATFCTAPKQICRSSSRSRRPHSRTTGALSTSTPSIQTLPPTSTPPRCAQALHPSQSQRSGRLGSRLGSC